MSINELVQTLDDVAGSLEGKGLLKEAHDIDIISNTLEKFAKRIPPGDDRPSPVFSDKDPKVKDGKDHFPIPDKNHARNALSRVNQYSEAPDWWDGSLEELKNKVVKKVKSKYPDIEINIESYK